jgi:carbon monoxide dehydrogenase subunit G
MSRLNGMLARNDGRSVARRLLLGAIGLMAFSVAVPAAADAAPQISVVEDHGIYRVAATFQVPQPPAQVIAVLKNYAQIPRFMPDVRTSTVLERGQDHAIVEQEALARFLMFSKRVHLVLEISEEPDTLRFRDRCGTSFARYDGLWRVSEQNGGTDVRYELNAQPSFDVPEFLLKRLLSRNASQMIEQLQREIAARSGR